MYQVVKDHFVITSFWSKLLVLLQLKFAHIVLLGSTITKYCGSRISFDIV